ncbi:KDO2-lipid IV(A) lauroyltransferase [Rubricella aquisinus]|uniref:KDO2-lipid IV(A) lauroyltransferase n=1 Tax=Rubricella aquisinus TaxID=2028108 RepID=A0A840X324_9RHOB|nr:lysophospholipid acyltransferase family protein [Rubricella aquisinus]MBB5516236.1 KDO2-lipid IV(A) lauroyltransferase [Rubricella aquisinus]
MNQLSTSMMRGAEWAANGLLRLYGRALRGLSYPNRVKVGAAVGRGLFARIPTARKRTFQNLERVAPTFDARKILRETSDNFGRVLVEETMMTEFLADPARFHVGGDGWADTLDALDAGRGPVIVTAHYGNWEGIRAAIRFAGHQMACVYRPHNNPHYNADFVASLHEVDPNAFPKGKEGTRGLVRHLRSGGGVMILADQKQTGAPLLPFLGHEAETALSPAKLALANDMPLIPAISRRRTDGMSFDVIFGTPITPSTPEQMMTDANAQLSDWIMEAPAQWFWFHRRWR